MTRLVKSEVKIECCRACPHFEFVDEGWASHHYTCKRLNLSSPSIGDPKEREKAFKEINRWFKKLCPEEVVNEGRR